MLKHKLLLIEDDIQLSEAITSYFDIKGYAIDKAYTAQDALTKLKQTDYATIILDLTLPDEDGLVLLRKIKQRYDTPILIASGRVDGDQRIAGLEIGAEDYVCKPFIIRELELRIEGLIKRNQKLTKSTNKINFGPYYIDEQSKQIKSQTDEQITLTALEYHVIVYLAQNLEKVLTREQIIDATNSLDGPESNRSVDICISRIRKKLEQDPKNPKLLLTVKGFGYRLTNPAYN